MNYTLLLIPVLSSFLVWLIFRIAVACIFHPLNPINFAGIKWQGLLPKNKQLIAAGVSAVISKEIINAKDISAKLTSPESLQKVMPSIEAHIDNFLNKKLKEAIPIITMFIGDKITQQLKELFLQELEELFPSVMSQIIGDLSQSDHLEKEINLKLQNISVAEMESRFYNSFKSELKKAELFFAAGGFIAGAIQLSITFWLMP